MYTFAQTLMQRRQQTGTAVATKKRRKVPSSASFDDLVKTLLHHVNPSVIANDAHANNLFLIKNDSHVELKQLQDDDDNNRNSIRLFETGATLAIKPSERDTVIKNNNPLDEHQRHISMSADGSYCAIAIGPEIYLFENAVANIDTTQIKQRYKVNCHEKIGPNSVIHQLFVTSSENGKRFVQLSLCFNQFLVNILTFHL